MSIESISSLKGLGGSYPISRGPSAAPSGQQDGLLRDTARELEQLFDEFQSLRNSISADSDLPSPPRPYVPAPRSGSVDDAIAEGLDATDSLQETFAQRSRNHPPVITQV